MARRDLINQNVQCVTGRIEAAKLLLIQQVPVLRLSDLSADERRAYVLADNKLAEKAGWDRDILAIEFQGLKELGIDIELTGFELGEIDVILAEAADKKPEADAADHDIPDRRDLAVSRAGDLWIMGTHRLLCGDALNPAAYDVVLDGCHADVVFTDPPYNVPIKGHVSGLGRITHPEFAMASGEMSAGEFGQFLMDFLSAALLRTRSGGILFVCMDWRHIAELVLAGKMCELALKNICVWVKDNGGMGSLYRSRHEFVAVFKRGSDPHDNNIELGSFGRNRTNVWEYAGVNSFRKGRAAELEMHPTVKPVAMVVDAIRDVSSHGDYVLDPFCGSGTTLIAAEKTGRIARAIEIDPHYVDVAVRRWQQLTGRRAVLQSSGQSFEDIEEARLNAKTSREVPA